MSISNSQYKAKNPRASNYRRYRALSTSGRAGAYADKKREESHGKQDIHPTENLSVTASLSVVPTKLVRKVSFGGQGLLEEGSVVIGYVDQIIQLP